MIKIGGMVLGSVQTNCYFVYKEGSTEVVVFDPADQGAAVNAALESKGFKVKAICLTHGHFDHIWGCNQLREASGAPVYALDAEQNMLENARINYSEQAGRAYTVKADHYVKDGAELTLAGLTFQVIATPGHTAGSCCYYFKEHKILISGDTLFQESVGRTDLPTGSGKAIRQSLNNILMKLPEDVKVYPGHGDSTTIGYEKKYNPFVG